LTTTEDGGEGRSSSLGGWIGRQRILLVVAAGVPALLYLVYVYHYAVNVPNADDWNVIHLAAAGIAHHLTLGQLWAQYGDTRLFVGFLIFVAFGVFDHLNEKSIILCSASVFVASFVLVLVLFRSYLGRSLSFLPVFSVGIIWFSLADVDNAFWSFQLPWYFVVLAFVTMACSLLLPRRHRNLWFGLGVLAAVAASFAEVQGFVVWPIGLICLLWSGRWRRRAHFETAIWVLATGLTVAFYLHRFVFAADTKICVLDGGTKSSCSLSFGLHHPLQLARFFVVLVGNMVPTVPGRYVVVHELLGTVICIVAASIVVVSVRERRLPTNPLPTLLIVFALLFDLMLALSRMGEGLTAASLDRYTMPNIIMLVGIVVFGWAHVPSFGHIHRRLDGVRWLQLVGSLVLAVFVVVQCTVATQFGITNARQLRAANERVARVVVNLDRLPAAERACYFQSVVVGPPISVLETARNDAVDDHLSLFAGDEQRYRLEGPPHIARCDPP